MRLDVLADALSAIKNAEAVGKKECVIRPVSKLVREVIKMMKDRGYLEDYEYIENKRGGAIKVKLWGRINECKAIKPRFPCKLEEIEKYEQRFLPARGFGFLIISTPKGLMTNDEAKKKGMGGMLIAYVY
ncbi:MAG: 30S ribosomal protein S8 [Nanoarchaeota archaeon]|nr:30S ribosomal protein S8 [Nanoarchaeota archaeon]